MIREGAKLALVVAVSVAVLTGFNLAIQSAAPEEPAGRVPPALFDVVPGAAEFDPVQGEGGEVLYYEARDGSGRLVGYGFVTTFRGMWSDIRVAGGLDREFRLTGIEVLEQGETPGLGDRIQEDAFESRFDGLSPEQVRLTRSGGEVDAVSGATVTSRAVTDGVREAAERVRSSAREGEP